MLTVSDGYNFTISSTNVTVTCISATARFEFNSVENVHISGITFQGCRNGPAVQMSGVSMAIVRKSNFTQNQGNSFQASNSVVTIIESNFYNNGGSSAIYASNSKILIKNSWFNNNTGSSDGSAILTQNSNLTVDSSEFSHNVAHQYGGAISVYQSLRTQFQINGAMFYGNRAGSGGAIYVSAYYGSLHIQINNTVVNFNTAHQGGAIYLFQYSYEYVQVEITLHNTTAYSNIAEQSDGGAMYIYSLSYRRSAINKQLSITQSQFINNTANQGNGGAIALYESTEIINTNSSVLAECQFSNNIARSGGAIHKNGKNTKLVIRQNSYDSNTANAFGGAIFVGGANNSVHVTSTTFINNKAITEGGGAIYSNGQYANVTLFSSTFHYNSAFFCGVLDVENYTHYSVNLTNSIFTYNTASGQTIGGGVACIVNASVNIINSIFKHNFANHHAGVFYIDESQTTVDGSLFINNSAALDGGVFYTYIHASDYIIRRSQFSENMAGGDGGVILIGRLNCYISIDETILDFNSAGNRGGVVSMIASSLFMETSRTNIFNNTAQFGGVISACNSHVTLVGDSLFVTVDPLLPFCKLYDGNVRHFNITSPPETIRTTEPIGTTEPLTHTKEIPMPSNPTSDQTDLATRATSNVAPQTIISDALTMATTVIDHTLATKTSTTGPLNDQSPLGIQSTTSALISDNKYYADGEIIDKKMTITIALSTTSLIVSLIAILVSAVHVLIVCRCKKGPLKNTLSKTKGFSINPFLSFHKYTSPIYNSNSGEDEDEDDADAP